MPSLTPLQRLSLSYVRGRVARKEIRPNTANRVRSILGTFCLSYGHRPVRNLGRRDIERWQESRGHLKPASRRNEFQAVRQFVRWLIAEKHLKSDPMYQLRAPKVPRSVPRAMPAADVERLQAALPDARARLVIALMVRMGMRRQEVITVQAGDYDPEGETLTIIGKGGHTRLLPVPPDVSQAIRAYMETRGWTAGPMILREDGMGGISNSRIGQMVRGFMEAAGVKQRPHDGRAAHALRHTAATNVVAVEPDLRVVQQFLGHASLTSTQRYLAHAELGKMRAALERSA
jgi:site-specific recombinase XerD